MTTKWYFARDGRQFGPFSVDRLKELAAGGQIGRQDTVWKEGTERRVLAAKVEHLFAETTAPAPLAASGDPAADSRPAACPPAAQPSPLAERLASPEDLELAPGTQTWQPAAAAPAVEEPPEAEAPPPRPPEPRKRRVLGVKGGVLMSQDGQVVKYRKKCLRCGYADTSLTTMPIRSGVTRVTFYCPKCRKSQAVEVQGVG